MKVNVQFWVIYNLKDTVSFKALPTCFNCNKINNLQSILIIKLIDSLTYIHLLRTRGKSSKINYRKVSKYLQLQKKLEPCWVGPNF